MASIRKDDKTGIYYIDLRIDGKRIRRSLETRDRTIAKMKARIIRREIAGSLLASSNSIADYELEYFTWAKSIKAPRTIEVEKSCFKMFREITNINNLSNINNHSIDKFISYITQKNSPATANYYIRTLRSIFNTALRWNYMAENPFRSAKLLRFELSPPRILTRSEIRKIFASAYKRAPELAQLFEFYLLTGLRRSEAINLQWSDIDYERNVITIRRTKGKRFRYVPMFKRVITILHSRKDLIKPFSARLDEVTKKFKLCAIAAGISNTQLHDLRRSFSSYLSEAGIPPVLIQKWLGHESFRVTDDHYLGTTEDQWKAILNTDLKLFQN